MQRAAQPRGTTLVLVLVVMVVVASLAGVLISRGAEGQRDASRRVFSTRALTVAESGLDYAWVELREDPLYAVRDEVGYAFEASTQSYCSAAIPFATAVGQTVDGFSLRVEYVDESGGSAVPVVFASRSAPTESYTSIRVYAAATVQGIEREVVGWFEEAPIISGVIISDMMPTDPCTGDDKSAAEDGHIVLSSYGVGPNIAVHGDLLSNGDVCFKETELGPMIQLTEVNAPTYLLNHSGEVQRELAGTSLELPDFTALGSAEQLFDFDRVEAVAVAGGGRVYTDFNVFLADLELANDGIAPPIEGVIVVHVDTSVPESPAWPDGGINIHGTLVFRFDSAVDPMAQVELGCPLAVNAADLTGVVPGDATTYTTGYPPVFSTGVPRAHEVDISAVTVNGRSGFANFAATDDLPAIMFDRAIVDIHGPSNVCGVVYGASFIEIEFKRDSYDPVDQDGDGVVDPWAMQPIGASDGNLFYFNGALYGGGGVLVRVEDAGDRIVLNYDANTVDSLAYASGAGSSLTRTRFAIAR